MTLTVAATQFACSWDLPANADRAEALVRQAAAKGAGLVLVQELFAAPYFCIEQHPQYFDLAAPAEGNPLIARFADLARELGVVMPVSFFERAGQAHFNSVAMVDADGRVLGIYRKTHIPQGPGYEEKYYFSPGDTGYRVWDTAAGRIGVGICWDQWFPECARSMALLGAEVLLYPTAIGSEPPEPGHDSQPHWETVMRGHAAANIMPVVASNRVGTEVAPDGREVTFYGSSFIADQTGQLVAKAGREGEAVLTASFDLGKIARMRRSWGLFRDRRPETYGAVGTLGG
ncbi:MAG: N-carbamoylputrescine amidase [Tabrizicola sp.]|uniref:N-carbamoylputrescine amidase n=1 Tax=Tabrizicola sp. TaxID=2005166 RepID=UPI002732FABE|nr:N-carbamoylputrescine amidase [Tabrizicola sp.]MDP3264115.1 N-carbamoylputrescine amidase [Tabrizicola sp.]MDP3648744.1 N-carbamoylputrescine amidase [Paracoccaceae bacterium]MDZ4067428.1 N-carbamoylputrescine amidase [Tabrizicola sp.]